MSFSARPASSNLRHRQGDEMVEIDHPICPSGNLSRSACYTCPCTQEWEAPLIIVTTENVTGHRTVRMLGQCFGVVVRSRGLGGNFMAGLRSIVGGEIHEYTQMLEEARRHALDRLTQNANAMGANAILMMRFDSAEIGNTMSEIVAYGTAAVIEPAP
jgi:uncharacterized protein YbjQ (UPF0145 family)